MAANGSSKHRKTTGSESQNKNGNRKLGVKANQQSAGFLDYETKRSIIGVALIVLSIALFVAVLLPSNAIITSALSEGLALLLGIGRYLIWLVSAITGVTFLFRLKREHMSARVALGFVLIFLAILVIIASFTPGIVTGSGNESLKSIFLKTNLVSHGGYIGAAIAYVFNLAFGQIITVILMLGLCVASIFIIGFSISSFTERIKEVSVKHSRTLEEKPAPVIKRIQNKANNHMSSSKGETKSIAANHTRLHKRTPFDGTQNQKDSKVSHTASKDVMLVENANNNTCLLGSNQVKADLHVSDSEDAKHKSTHAAETAVLKQEDSVSWNNEHDKESKKTSHTSASSEGNLKASIDTKARFTRKLGVIPEFEPPNPEENEILLAGLNMPSNNKKEKQTKLTSTENTVDVESADALLPDFSLLTKSDDRQDSAASDEELRETAGRLQETIQDFGISIEVVDWIAGPTVTLFKVSLPSGVRVNRITALADDIALALAAPGVRIFAPIPGTNYVGIEVPNSQRQTVYLGDVLQSAPAGPMQMAVGKDVEGNRVVIDLAKAPHLLIGGTTGSGKSVAINSFIMSILMRATPDEVRMILIDPKRVEFTLYNGIPHLYLPVVEDPKDASAALSWGVAEMERRLKLFSAAGVRNIAQYNTKIAHESTSEEDEEVPALPYLLIVIDELADLMMNVGKEVEFSISRIAQLARAAGIHLIVATQRPSANVVTGLIKSNITTRMAFTVASGIDSRVILDTTGAENLINYGDMLLSKPDLSKPQRLQACYVSEDEINAVVEFWKTQGEPDYHSEILQTNVFSLGDTATDGSSGKVVSDDPLLWEAADIVVAAGSASTSYIQRRLSVGYARAGRIMDMLENKGIVGPACGSKAREVLVDTLELESLKAFEQSL